MFFTKENYAIDPANRKYAHYVRDDVQYRQLKRRYQTIRDRYEREYVGVQQRYQKNAAYMSSVEFWNTYLKNAN
jgi:hypothetical protein